MTEIRLHNTLSAKSEAFVPQKAGEVRMYTCGPTVYDYAHIGNYRTFVFQDILRRFLKLRGFKLNHVMNLTDVDDRIIANAAAAGKSIRDYTEKFVQAFFDDCRSLSIEAPEHWIRATDHIDDMVKLIERLQQKTFTYPSEGSIYYRIAKFPEYGKLSKVDLTGIQAGARVDNDRYEKESARDFALWKAPKPGEHFWETPIGPGRPGWHIECSAMAMKYLGDTLDIHTGGIDLAFPHHENEIAQSEAATGKQFVRYWLHAQFLQDAVGEKMSKRLKNFSTLRDILAEGYQPRAIRYALMTGAHYRSPLAFSSELLKAAASSVKRLDEFAVRLGPMPSPLVGEGQGGPIPSPFAGEGQGGGLEVQQRWDDALRDDLNLPAAVGHLFEFIKAFNMRLESGKATADERAAALAMLRHANRILDV